MTHTQQTASGRTIGRSLAPALILLVSAACAMGCSQDDPTQGHVKGRVLVNGAAAEMGSIIFTPIDGSARTVGCEIVAGKYAVDAPVGTARVEIRVPKVVGERKTYSSPDSPVHPVFEETLPAKFNSESELTYEVRSGDQDHDFDLQTGAG